MLLERYIERLLKNLFPLLYPVINSPGGLGIIPHPASSAFLRTSAQYHSLHSTYSTALSSVAIGHSHIEQGQVTAPNQTSRRSSGTRLSRARWRQTWSHVRPPSGQQSRHARKHESRAMNATIESGPTAAASRILAEEKSMGEMPLQLGNYSGVFPRPKSPRSFCEQVPPQKLVSETARRQGPRLKIS